jgi:aspartyl-tRNA(Asn)/glutamyl-tRNA(Gln) amidotransferase subunit A
MEFSTRSWAEALDDPEGTATRRRFLQWSVAAGAGAVAARAASGDELTRLPLQQASAMVRRKGVSPVELTHACLRRIERLNPVLNAFISVTGKEALEQAAAAEREIRNGKWRGPMHGIPVAFKDLFDTAGIRTTAASAVFADRIPVKDAEVVRRLKEAGAIVLGKLNMDEFAYSFTSETSHFGPTHNPWKLGYITGGSSSGSAAAVAAGLCYAALGSDTGGSIREPASYCGVVGLKPTYGLVSTTGVIPLSWTLDHVGPICRTTRDAAIVLGVIAGFDASDPNSLNALPQDYLRAMDAKVSSFRLGIPRAGFCEDVDAEIQSAMTAAIRVLSGLTKDSRDVRLPNIDNSPVLPVEAYTFHAHTLAATPDLYHPRIRANLERGATITSAAYAQSRRDIDQLRRDIVKVFDQVDLLITPTTPRLPVPLDPYRAPDPAMLRNTRPFNLNGLPAITLPCGFSTAGLPIGIQIAGPRLAESKLLALANAFEQATVWHNRRPPLE